MDSKRRSEILAEMAQDTDRMWRKMEALRKSGSRPVSMADLEDFRNEATDAMDSFRALCVAVDAHDRECAGPAVAFVSPAWEPCTTMQRAPGDDVSAWDCRMNGDLWTLEFTALGWRLWGPADALRQGVETLTTAVSVSETVVRHLAHQSVKDYYAARNA